MFGEKDRALKLVDGDTMTLLDKDAQFEGKLTFDGKVQINGKFRGEIFSEGTLIIGQGAQVDARIDIDTVIIQGQVNGTIQAKSRIEMHPPAVVKGDIASPNLVISEGALFEGSCSMGTTPGKLLELSPRDEEVGVDSEDSDEVEEPEIENFHDAEPVQEDRAMEVDSLF